MRCAARDARYFTGSAWHATARSSHRATGRPPRVLDEHAELLTALKEQDARKAAKAMQAHITAGHRDFKATFALEPRR